MKQSIIFHEPRRKRADASLLLELLDGQVARAVLFYTIIAMWPTYTDEGLTLKVEYDDQDPKGLAIRGDIS
jgi:hypothetical protein